MIDFAVEMSRKITVAKYGKEHGTVSATEAFRGNGEHITTFRKLLPSELEPIQRLYFVAEGLEFVWLFLFYGHNQTVLPRALVPPLDPNLLVTIESVSKSPRVFRIYIFLVRMRVRSLLSTRLR